MANLTPLVCLLLGWPDPPPASTPPAPIDVVTALETTIADAIAKAESSVVAIARLKSDGEATTAVRGRNGSPPIGPLNQDTLFNDYGAGVVIGNKGEILTAFHVVEGASLLYVRGLGGEEFE